MKDKYVGIAKVGEKGQIIIPVKARKLFGLNAGDQLVVLGDESQGLALIPAKGFMEIMDLLRRKDADYPNLGLRAWVLPVEDAL